MYENNDHYGRDSGSAEWIKNDYKTLVIDDPPARPIVPPEAITIFNLNLYCEILKYGRTTSVKIEITTNRD